MRCLRSAWRRICGLSMLAATPVAARDAATAVAACTDDARLFLELSALILATVALSVSTQRCWSHCRRRTQPLQQQQPTPDRWWWTTLARSNASRFSLALKLLLALLLAAWGISGLFLAGTAPDDGSPGSLGCDASSWLVPTAVTVSCACLLAALWLVTQLVADAVRRSVANHPSQASLIFALSFCFAPLVAAASNPVKLTSCVICVCQTPVALRCLRCSCCPFALPRALVLLPLLLLAVLALRSWLAFRPFHPCEQQLATFFAGAAIVFALMATAATVAFVYSSLSATACWNRSAHREPAEIDSVVDEQSINQHAKRRAARVVLALALGTLAIAGVSWGVIGLSWLQRIQDSVPACSNEALDSFGSAVDEARIFAAALLVVGIVLLATTMCCRPENFFLATGMTPPVDAMMLSPSLIDASRLAPPSQSSKREITTKTHADPGTPHALALANPSTDAVV